MQVELKAQTNLNVLLTQENEKLQVELTKVRDKFSKFYISSEKVSRIIGIGKTHNNKEGLGYDGASKGSLQLMKENNVSPVTKIDEIHMFRSAPKSVSEPRSITDYQSPQVSNELQPSAHLSRYVSKSKFFTPTCHFCGMNGHIRSPCLKLYRYTTAPPQYYANSNKSKIYRPRHKVTPQPKDRNVISKHMPKIVRKVKTKLIWVRKLNLVSCEKLPTNPLDGTGSSRGIDFAF